MAAVLLGIADIDDETLRDELGAITTWRQLLDYLQVKVVPFEDRIEIQAVLPIQNIDVQHYCSTSPGKGKTLFCKGLRPLYPLGLGKRKIIVRGFASLTLLKLSLQPRQGVRVLHRLPG